MIFAQFLQGFRDFKASRQLEKPALESFETKSRKGDGGWLRYFKILSAMFIEAVIEADPVDYSGGKRFEALVANVRQRSSTVSRSILSDYSQQ